MSLLGLDVGTTGCKAAVFSTDGRMLAFSYREYDIRRPKPEWAEVDSAEVWSKVKETIREVAPSAKNDPVCALAVSSMGEATVPVTQDRQILGPSLLNFDGRGAEFLPDLAKRMDNERLYRINGNAVGNHYSLTKLMWIKQNQPDLYHKAYKFLHWSGFVCYMLGGEPAVDYSLANRTLLFDVDKEDWSDELFDWSGLDHEKLPRTAPSGTVIGKLNPHLADDLGLAGDIAIVTGSHDQCANGVGAGVVSEGQAMFGMGTYFTAMPVFSKRQPPEKMLQYGVNTEHHAAPGLYVSFLYNHGGSMFKWYRDTFAGLERQLAQESGKSIYADLLAEMPPGPSKVMVLPHFEQTGPPYFIADSAGVIAGVKLGTSRAEILKAILESVLFYIRELLEPLPSVGIDIQSFRAVGGGSRSDAWPQISADILGKPFVRPATTEAGCLGAAIMAGTAVGVFSSMQDAAQGMVKLDKTYEPNLAMHRQYDGRFDLYKRIYPLMADYLREVSK